MLVQVSRTCLLWLIASTSGPASALQLDVFSWCSSWAWISFAYPAPPVDAVHVLGAVEHREHVHGLQEVAGSDLLTMC